MLILTRRVGETICIGDDIRLTVTGVREPGGGDPGDRSRGGEVSLGVEVKMPPGTVPGQRCLRPTKNEEKPS